MSSNLTWKAHISKKCINANKTLRFVKRNVNISDTQVKAQAYISLVRQQQEYCVTIWDPHQKDLKHKIEMVQHRAARYAMG